VLPQPSRSLPPPGPATGKGSLAGALEELRELSHGIHPAILTHGGLAPALKNLARRSAVPVELQVNLQVNAPTRPPEPVEVAVYYVVSEALTNTAKLGFPSYRGDLALRK
jgi:signal transduction histidine kinase